MKHQLKLLTTAAIVAAASPASAQGLMSIGHSADQDFEHKLPFVLTVGAGIGYDTNPDLRPSNEKGSAYASASIMAAYSSGDRRTAYSFSASYSPLYYFDAPAGINDWQNNARVNFDWRHRVNERLTLTNSAYLAYEVEPNFGIGASVSRRVEPYFYGYDSFAAAYSWNRRFSTVTSFTIAGISYDGNGSDDYISYTIGNEFRYAMSRTTTAALTLRYAVAEYDSGFGDYDSWFILAGLDHKFSPRLTGSFRVGAEIRDRDFGGSMTEPYGEGSLSYRVSRKTDIRAYSRFGFQDSDIGGYGKRYGYRFGASANHRFNTRLSGNAGLHYVHDEFSQGGPNQPYDEDVFALSLGFDYALYRNISLNGGYSWTNNSSDLNGRGYDRHHFQLGVTARF